MTGSTSILFNYVECCILFNVMINVFVVNFVMPIAIMPYVAMHNVAGPIVIMLNVVKPNVVRLNVIIPNAAMPIVIMQNLIKLNVVGKTFSCRMSHKFSIYIFVCTGTLYLFVTWYLVVAAIFLFFDQN